MTGYAFFYLGSLLLFAILSSRLLRARNVDRKLRNLFTLVYLVGMVMGAHALYYVFCEHTLVNQSLVKTYDRLWDGRDELRSISGLLAASARLREATVLQGGFWGGPWFAVMALLPFILYPMPRLNEGMKSTGFTLEPSVTWPLSSTSNTPSV